MICKTLAYKANHLGLKYETKLFLFFLIITLLSYFFCSQYANASSISLFLQLKSDNHILLLRHSLAPGTGDPDNFNLSDCSTQRNLSKHGVQQAKKIGKILKENNIKEVNIYSSEWCRCKETANLQS